MRQIGMRSLLGLVIVSSLGSLGCYKTSSPVEPVQFGGTVHVVAVNDSSTSIWLPSAVASPSNALVEVRPSASQEVFQTNVTNSPANMFVVFRPEGTARAHVWWSVLRVPPNGDSSTVNLHVTVRDIGMVTVVSDRPDIVDIRVEQN